MKITNKYKLSLPLAVLLSHSNYDHDSSIKTISATKLLKPIRATILEIQNPHIKKEVDLADLIPSVFGSAVHSFAEKAWNTPSTVSTALSALGVAEDTAKRIKINPETVAKGDIPIYVERRSSRELNGWTIRGKFDVCVDGKLSDYKNMSVWGHIYDSNSSDFTIQGSIYKWLNPTIVTANNISIEKIFSDWSSSKAKYTKNYPKLRVLSKDYPLMSLPDIEKWIIERLALLDKHISSQQSDLPLCNNDELWVSKKSEVKRCIYCNVMDICHQAQAFIAEGRLKV